MGKYSDTEEVEKLKDWWKTYGNALIVGVILGIAVLFGNKYWESYRTEQREAASAIYEKMAVNLKQKKINQVKILGSQLMKDYANTPYAGIAALIMAKASYEKGDIKGANKYLVWAMNKATVGAVKHTARLRLGRILLEQNNPNAAIDLVNAVKDEEMAGYRTEYFELKGDIHLAKGQPGLARNAYKEALKQTPKSSGYYQILAMKLDDVTEASALTK